jgi:hypothetical protein
VRARAHDANRIDRSLRNRTNRNSVSMVRTTGPLFGASTPQFPGGGGRDRTDDLRLAKPALSQLSYTPSGTLLLRRSKRMVGLGRLELPTSRLSSARSNQLSYRPTNFGQKHPRSALGPAIGGRGLGPADGMEHCSVPRHPNLEGIRRRRRAACM